VLIIFDAVDAALKVSITLGHVPVYFRTGACSDPVKVTRSRIVAKALANMFSIEWSIGFHLALILTGGGISYH
jgi:hypothetical protein